MFWREVHLIINYFCKVVELVLDIFFLSRCLYLFRAHICQDQLDLLILLMLIIVHLILVLGLFKLLYFELLLQIMGFIVFIFDRLFIVMLPNLVIEIRAVHFKD